MRIVQDQEDEGGTPEQEAPKKKKKQDLADRGEKCERDKRIASLLEGWVLDTLGRPPGFSYVKAYHLWEDRFRVNVWANDRISDSFFIHAVLDGITYSSPVLEKKYADAATSTSNLETGPDPGVVEETTSPDAE